MTLNPRSLLGVQPQKARVLLGQERQRFRGEMAAQKAGEVWASFDGRIGTVLTGGGARGAYQVGGLLAFQDAGLPTHIITATSVGSINAASYAAQSDGLVGNAESLAESWFNLTPLDVGVEWARYIWMLFGLITASIGFENLMGYVLAAHGFSFSLHDPAHTWIALGVGGTAVLLSYDRLSYIAYVARNLLRDGSWKPDGHKTAISLIANLIVWSCLVLAVSSLHPHVLLANTHFHPRLIALVGGALGILVLLRYVFSGPLSTLLHRMLRLPLRSGLFANFERSRLLRQRISVENLRASPVRVVFTATDLGAGVARFFSNQSPDQLAADPRTDARFIDEEITKTDDLIGAVVASSALPIIYEPMTFDGRVYSDGGIIANQPIRPAIRLGADVLFLVMMNQPVGLRGEVKTFIDVGQRAFDILMLQNMMTDLKILTGVNALCERAAARLSLHPEEIEIDSGMRRYRYIKTFAIQPGAPLAGTRLDFTAKTTGPAILQGYLDACIQIENFLAYARQAKFGGPKRVLRFVHESDSFETG